MITTPKVDSFVTMDPCKLPSGHLDYSFTDHVWRVDAVNDFTILLYNPRTIYNTLLMPIGKHHYDLATDDMLRADWGDERVDAMDDATDSLEDLLSDIAGLEAA